MHVPHWSVMIKQLKVQMTLGRTWLSDDTARLKPEWCKSHVRFLFVSSGMRLVYASVLVSQLSYSDLIIV
ncbi:hypothetical protein L6164_014388 [Bauhinia variegata]|uniref:Uncharacterized protein n=1 Tax=Bauhinia variegata TaxID=167791 RepID=A0ACB9NID5_BAUVA|nr:hypothetical protein L6164_014388 [Bauhinia variegata]